MLAIEEETVYRLTCLNRGEGIRYGRCPLIFRFSFPERKEATWQFTPKRWHPL